jgi:hypothetical protein
MQQVKVERAVQFVGSAANKDNIDGNPSFNKIVFFDDFTAKTLDVTNDYTATLIGGDGSAATITATVCGAVRLINSHTDQASNMLATTLTYDVSKNPIAEARFYLSDITKTAFFFGFSDAVLETTPAMPIDDAGATHTAAAEDVAGFVIDADSTVPSEILCASATTAGAATATHTVLSAVNATYLTCRVALNSSGDAEYYLNGNLMAIHQSALSDVPLCIIFAWANRAASAAHEYVAVDYVKSWQDR